MNVRDLLRDLRVPFREHGESPHVTEGWVGIVCPMPGCGQGAKFGRGIHTRTLKTTCWKCGPARLGDVLAAASGRPLREILAKIGGTLPEAPRADEPPPGKYLPPRGVGPLLAEHRDYLASRGFDPDELASVWGVRGIGPVGGRFQWRLFIPAVSGGVPVSWTTRAIGAKATRYIAAGPADEAVPLKSVLSGSDLCRHAVVITEGFFDAARIGPGAVWTGGLGVTPRQLLAASRFPVRVVCFDNDPSARRRADAVAASLDAFPGETYVATLSGADPAESPAEEIRELRARFLD